MLSLFWCGWMEFVLGGAVLVLKVAVNQESMRDTTLPIFGTSSRSLQNAV